MKFGPKKTRKMPIARAMVMTAKTQKSRRKSGCVEGGFVPGPPATAMAGDQDGPASQSEGVPGVHWSDDKCNFWHLAA
eukprot:CAMPEP_0171209568 /NCGR_PEP_ID=MMETSP0790-20130122/28661_1 /TAXON_ID=2925 /ORGANISM="Alexandrium catenella, Strain OF101" /LENGTH=77 /DNA_ID=CAMNT_0011675179 /DNA_START=275 /DNA_END=505 /DNA_ORIENTATION=+